MFESPLELLNTLFTSSQAVCTVLHTQVLYKLKFATILFPAIDISKDYWCVKWLKLWSIIWVDLVWKNLPFEKATRNPDPHYDPSGESPQWLHRLWNLETSTGTLNSVYIKRLSVQSWNATEVKRGSSLKSRRNYNRLKGRSSQKCMGQMYG